MTSSSLKPIVEYLDIISAVTITRSTTELEALGYIQLLRGHVSQLLADLRDRQARGEMPDTQSNRVLVRLYSEIARIKADMKKVSGIEISVSSSSAADAPSAPTASGPATFEEELPLEIPFSEIHFGSEIGQGAFSRCFSGTCCSRAVAIKQLNSSGWLQEQRDAVLAEVAIARRVVGPCAVQFLGTSTNPSGELLILTELMKGDLEHHIYDKRRPPLTLDEKVRLLFDAAAGMNWLHAVSKVIHRDVKSPNFLIDENGTVKVGDFGLSDIGRAENVLKGSKIYCAPEVLMEQNPTNKLDVYSFSLVMFEVMFEEPVFPHHRVFETFKHAICVMKERPVIPRQVVQKTDARRAILPAQDPPARFVELMRHCWDQEPAARPDFAHISDQLFDILLELLIPVPPSPQQFPTPSPPVAETRAFWKKSFGPVLQVSWPDMARAIAKETGAAAPAIEPLRDVLCCSWDTHSSMEFVHVKNFRLVALWFGAFFLPGVGPTVVRAINATNSCQWFHWRLLSSEVAHSRLTGMKAGTFLVRPSTGNPYHCPFTIDIASGSDAIHLRIYRSEVGSPYQFSINIPKTEQRMQFNDLDVFIDTTLTPGNPLGLTSILSREDPPQKKSGPY